MTTLYHFDREFLLPSVKKELGSQGGSVFGLMDVKVSGSTGSRHYVGEGV